MIGCCKMSRPISLLRYWLPSLKSMSHCLTFSISSSKVGLPEAIKDISNLFHQLFLLRFILVSESVNLMYILFIGCVQHLRYCLFQIIIQYQSKSVLYLANTPATARILQFYRLMLSSSISAFPSLICLVLMIVDTG